MSEEKYPIRLVGRNGQDSRGAFLFNEEDNADNCHLVLQHPNGEITAEADDYFEAMCQIRRQAETFGLVPVCYGSSLNVYPSNMGRDMGRGLKAYKIQLGQRARTADLVEIFSVGPDVQPSLIAEQRAFYELWLESLK